MAGLRDRAALLVTVGDTGWVGDRGMADRISRPPSATPPRHQTRPPPRRQPGATLPLEPVWPVPPRSGRVGARVRVSGASSPGRVAAAVSARSVRPAARHRLERRRDFRGRRAASPRLAWGPWRRRRRRRRHTQTVGTSVRAAPPLAGGQGTGTAATPARRPRPDRLNPDAQTPEWRDFHWRSWVCDIEMLK